ncbi:hypothetical protein RQP46_010715 [Phenoliferia psychrophenolica]
MVPDINDSAFSPHSAPPGLPPPGIPIPLPLLLSRRSANSSSNGTSSSTPPSTTATSPPHSNENLYSTPTSPVPTTTETHLLDRHAEVFVQAWLKDVNTAAHHHVVFQPSPQIPFPLLHSSLFPALLLSLELSRESSNHARIASSLPQGFEPQPPTVAARRSQLESANLYSVPLLISETDPTRFTLVARSIREGWPPVALGDAVVLRQVYPDQRGWQGIIYEANVESVSRAEGQVLLRCDAFANPMYRRNYSGIFNVQWRVQDRVFHHWRTATEALDYELNIHFDPSIPPLPLGRKTVAENWLFPVPEDVDPPPPDIARYTRIDNLDPSLNEQQRHAVEAICWGNHKVPFLISGPPGTGKTKTLVEAILQILLRHPFTHILVCGASDPSADTLARRLSKSLPPSSLLRLNPPSRPFSEVGMDILPWCHVEEELFALPSLPTLLSKRVIVTTCLDSFLLHQARCTNTLLGKLEHQTFSAIHPTMFPQIPPPHFGFLLVDEGAQATEPDVLCALAVVVSNQVSSARAHVTLCGDSKQLGPVVLYHDTLEPYAPQSTQTSLLHQWSGLPTQGFPIIFHGLAGIDEPVDEGASFYNEAEVDYVCETITQLLHPKNQERHGPLKEKDISVISPYREQVWRIRLKLRTMGFGGVDVGNVEALQGAENRVVIISAVRSNERWLKGDKVQSRGLIYEPKRWNVAMTRAKELLIVVGNVRLLTRDHHWLAFYRFCQRNGCYTGMAVVDGSATGAAEGISRLEEQWRAGSGPGGDEAAFDVLVGSMARETLDGDDDDDEVVRSRI